MTLEELREFAREFVTQRGEGGVIGLSGDLGAGKTTFVRGCIEAIAQKHGVYFPTVISPTFVFHQRYAGPFHVDHFDLYRLENAEEKSLLEIGYFDALERQEEFRGFVFVEWPEKVRDVKILQLTERLQFSVTSPSSRNIVISK